MLTTLIPQRPLVLALLIALPIGHLLISNLVSTASTSTAASTPSRTITYTHDNAGRLVQADYGDGIRITYAYDNAGNLLRLETVGPLVGGRPPMPASTPTSIAGGTPSRTTASSRGCALGG